MPKLETVAQLSADLALFVVEYGLKNPHIKSDVRGIYRTCRSDVELYTAINGALATAAALRNEPAHVFELADRRNAIAFVRFDERIVYHYDGPLTRKRRTWDEFFMATAQDASEMSTCMSGRQVGAVFVRNKTPLVTSFNGVPPSFPHPKSCLRIERNCKSGEDLHLCPCNHAETNGVARASREGISLKDSVLYCTTKPCSSCMGVLASLGLAKIIYRDGYPDEATDAIARAVSLPVVRIGEEDECSLTDS